MALGLSLGQTKRAAAAGGGGEPAPGTPGTPIGFLLILTKDS